MTTPPPCRRHPCVSIRRVQSERKYLSSWSTPQPHMVGMSQGVLHGYYPMAGQPFLFMAPQVMFNPSVSVVREEDIMAQDRLASFLVGEAPPHRPRSLLSYPDSHVYESLISQMSELSREEICIESKEENVTERKPEVHPKSCERCTTCKKVKPPRPVSTDQETDHKPALETPNVDSLLKNQSVINKSKLKSNSTESIFNKPPTKSYVKTYQKLLSLFRFKKKQPISDIYEEIPPSATELEEPLIQKLPDIKDVILEPLPTKDQPTSTTLDNIIRPDPILMKIWESNLKVQDDSKKKIGTFVVNKKMKATDKATQVSVGDFEYVTPNFSTLDPLRPHSRAIASKSMLDLRKKATPDSESLVVEKLQETIGPLVVDFDSESSEDDHRTDGSWHSNGHDSCLYSSGDLCSLAHKNSDSFVFVYKMDQKDGKQTNLKIQNPLTPDLSQVQVVRRGGSSGLGSSGSEFSSNESSKYAKQEDPSTISFTEPCFNSGLTVGSKGHLQFDYSWSWNHLNNYVRHPDSRIPLPQLPHFLRSALPLETYANQLIM